MGDEGSGKFTDPRVELRIRQCPLAVDERGPLGRPGCLLRHRVGEGGDRYGVFGGIPALEDQFRLAHSCEIDVADD